MVEGGGRERKKMGDYRRSEGKRGNVGDSGYIF
jgi:hypothetical protein